MKSIKYMFGCALLWGSLSLISCDNADSPALNDAVYLVESENGVENLLIDDETGNIGSVTVKKASPASEDVKVTLQVSKADVDEYNSQNGTNYEILPEGSYEILTPEVTIKAGEVSSERAEVKILPLSEEMKNSGKKYILPIAIASTSNPNLQILNNRKSAYYGCTFVLISKAVVVPQPVAIDCHMRQEYNLPEWTLEMRIKTSICRAGINNQAFCNIISDKGPGSGYIYGRFEGANLLLAVNQKGCNFQIEGGPKPNTWYHLAVVYRASSGTVECYLNGVLNNTVQASQFEKVCNFSANKFKLALTNKRGTFTMHEVRWWTKAISASQIKNNMFNIDPQSDGLEAYWKMNEGEGAILHDATGHGNDAELTPQDQLGKVKWETVRSDGK